MKDVNVARPPVPPFSLDTAIEKVRLAEDGWNTRNPEWFRSRTASTACGATAPNS